MSEDQIIAGAVDRIRASHAWRRQHCKAQNNRRNRGDDDPADAWIARHVSDFREQLRIGREALRAAWGINENQHAWRYMSEEEAATITRLYLEGRSVREIQAMTKRGYESVRSKLTRSGLYGGKRLA